MHNQSSKEAVEATRQKVQATSTSREERYEQLSRLARALLNVAHAVITPLGHESQDSSSRINTEQLNGRSIQPWLSEVIRSGKPVVIEDANDQSHLGATPMALSPKAARFYAGVPILDSNNELIGVFSIYDASPRKLTKDDLTVLEELARKAESAFNCAKQVQLEPAPRLIDNFFVIRKLHSLRMLEDSELMLLLRVAKLQTFPPGFQIAEASQPMNRLYLLVEGAFENEEALELHSVVGAVSLLLNEPPAYPVYAGPQGAKCIVMLKAQYFTLINECPKLIHSLIEMVSFGNK